MHVHVCVMGHMSASCADGSYVERSTEYRTAPENTLSLRAFLLIAMLVHLSHTLQLRLVCFFGICAVYSRGVKSGYTSHIKPALYVSRNTPVPVLHGPRGIPCHRGDGRTDGPMDRWVGE